MRNGMKAIAPLLFTTVQGSTDAGRMIEVDVRPDGTIEEVELASLRRGLHSCYRPFAER